MKRYIKLERGSVYSVLALEYKDMEVKVTVGTKTYSDKTCGMNFIALDKKYPTVMLTFSQLYTFEMTFNELVQRCFLLNV